MKQTRTECLILATLILTKKINMKFPDETFITNRLGMFFVERDSWAFMKNRRMNARRAVLQHQAKDEQSVHICDYNIFITT